MVPSNDCHRCPSDRPAHWIIAASVELLGDDFDLPVLDSGLNSVAEISRALLKRVTQYEIRWAERELLPQVRARHGCLLGAAQGQQMPEL